MCGMPVRYERDDALRRVVVTVDGALRKSDMLTVIARQRAEDTWSYGTLFDLRRVTEHPTITDLRELMDAVIASSGGAAPRSCRHLGHPSGRLRSRLHVRGARTREADDPRVSARRRGRPLAGRRNEAGGELSARRGRPRLFVLRWRIIADAPRGSTVQSQTPAAEQPQPGGRLFEFLLRGPPACTASSTARHRHGIAARPQKRPQTTTRAVPLWKSKKGGEVAGGQSVSNGTSPPGFEPGFWP
jgi:hypothetical protein